MTLHLFLQVKFRFLSFTLGTFQKIIELNVDLLNRKIQVQAADGSLPAGAHTLVNERGILLASWL